MHLQKLVKRGRQKKKILISTVKFKTTNTKCLRGGNCYEETEMRT